MSVSDRDAFASVRLASTASNYFVRHIMSIICNVWSAFPPTAPLPPPPLTVVSHWSIQNLFEVWKRFANSWNWCWCWCWCWGCRDEDENDDDDDEPKRVVSSLCSFFGCAFLRKCLPTFGFIINFKKLLMAATRCPKMADWRPPPAWLECLCVCVCAGVWPKLSVCSPFPSPPSAVLAQLADPWNC